MFSAHARDAHALARLIKKIDRGLITVFGGPHASIYPKLTCCDPNVDFVIYGEGEETFLELLKNMPKKNFDKIHGLVYKNGKKVIVNPRRPFIANLDNLPFPKRDLFPLKIYQEANKNSPYIMRRPIYSMQTSRGCVGICTFCSIHSVWQHCWRARSAKNVVDEIEFLIKKYGAGEIQGRNFITIFF